jgi:hypothetical protein
LLRVEQVIDGAVGGEKALCGTLGFEPLLFSLPLSKWQVVILSPIVLPHAAGSVAIQNSRLSYGRAIRGQLVSRDCFWMPSCNVTGSGLLRDSHSFNRRPHGINEIGFSKWLCDNHGLRKQFTNLGGLRRYDDVRDVSLLQQRIDRPGTAS